MTVFVTCKHPDVEGTGLIPQSALDAGEYPGWTPVTDDPPAANDGTKDDVLTRVGSDPAAAQSALDAELASSKPRTTLVDALTAITHQEP